MPVPNALVLRHSPARALVAGLANTVFGLAVIAIALQLGATSFAANLAGYGAGWGLSFLLNRHYVFANQQGGLTGQGVRFIGAIAASYGANLGVLYLAEQQLGAAPLVAQILAMATYTVCLYVLCRTFVFSPNISDDAQVRLATAAMAIVAFLALAGSRLTHDVVWQLWIARQMANGVQLYTEIIEINPPLWFWMGLGFDNLATVFGWSPALLLKAVIIAWAATAVLLTDSLHERGPLKPRLATALASFAIIAILPGYDFGQREQMALIAALPYAALVAARSQRREVAVTKALVIGILAACGIALKHYFVAVPVALELFLLFHLRKDYGPFRPETMMLIVGAVIYAAAVVTFNVEFLTGIVPLVNLAYDGYQTSFLNQLIGPHQVVIYAILIAIYFNRNIFASQSKSSQAYMLTAAAFSVAYFAQQKGWQYHAVPIVGLLTLVLTLNIISALQRGIPVREIPLAIFALLLALFASLVWIGPYSSRSEAAFNAATRDLSPGDTVFTASTGPTISWPMVEERGFKWPSRYFAMWTTPSIVLTPRSDPRHESLEKLAERIRSDTYHDLLCNPPKVLMFENPSRSRKLREAGFSYFDFFRKSERLSQFLSHYEYRWSSDGVAVFDLREDAKLPGKPSDCRIVF